MTIQQVVLFPKIYLTLLVTCFYGACAHCKKAGRTHLTSLNLGCFLRDFKGPDLQDSFCATPMPLLSPHLPAMNKRLVIPEYVNKNISNPEFETKECRDPLTVRNV